MIIAHMLGDYVFQNDYLAKDKVLNRAKYEEDYHTIVDQFGDGMAGISCSLHEYIKIRAARSRAICFMHCMIYTLLTFVCTFLFMDRHFGFLGLGIVLITHFFIDHFRLAREWMSFAGQDGFAQNFGDWAVVIVDNTFHLVTFAAVVLIYKHFDLYYLL